MHCAVPAAPASEEEVAWAARAALEWGGRPELELSVVLVDEPTMTDLHLRFLDDPSPTDVIAFDLGAEGGGVAAEVYVSVDQARLVAAERGRDERAELVLYVVHGVLHLCGYDDHEEAERRAMRAAEVAVLDGLGLAADPDFHGA